MSLHTPQLPRLRNYIGKSFQSCQETDLAILNPSDGKVLGFQASSTREAMNEALTFAERCHKSKVWFALGAQRADYLLAIAKNIEAHTEELALLEALNTGVLYKQTQQLMRLLPLIFKAAAHQVLAHPDCQILPGKSPIELWHKPWGPALCLAPWNSPAPISAHKIASALAAGAPVILKPSEYTPFSSQRLFEIIAMCDLPAGVIQLLHGSGLEGSYLAADKRIKAVSFTGGLKGGQALSQVCQHAMKPLQLELGGHNPFVILPDANLNESLDGLLAGLTTLNGQWCRAIGRIFVPDTMKQRLIDGFLERLQNFVLGPALDPHSMMGPLIHRQHKQHIQQLILEKQSLGGLLIGLPESDPYSGCYLSPKLITDLNPQLDQSEIFGPVACLHTYRQVDELVPLVNDSPFGLAAYIYGSDTEFMFKLAQDFEVGSTKINCVSMTSLSPEAPRSAWGMSGLGDEGNFETFRFFQGSTVIGSVAKNS